MHHRDQLLYQAGYGHLGLSGLAHQSGPLCFLPGTGCLQLFQAGKHSTLASSFPGEFLQIPYTFLVFMKESFKLKIDPDSPFQHRPGQTDASPGGVTMPANVTVLNSWFISIEEFAWQAAINASISEAVFGSLVKRLSPVWARRRLIEEQVTIAREAASRAITASVDSDAALAHRDIVIDQLKLHPIVASRAKVAPFFASWGQTLETSTGNCESWQTDPFLVGHVIHKEIRCLVQAQTCYKGQGTEAEALSRWQGERFYHYHRHPSHQRWQNSRMNSSKGGRQRGGGGHGGSCRGAGSTTNSRKHWYVMGGSLSWIILLGLGHAFKTLWDGVNFKWLEQPPLLSHPTPHGIWHSDRLRQNFIQHQ